MPEGRGGSDVRRVLLITAIAMGVSLALPMPLAQADGDPPANYDLKTECKNTQGAAGSYDTWEEVNFPGAYYDDTGEFVSQDRILLEQQAWWFPTPEDFGGTGTGLSYGHTHTTLCAPNWVDETNDEILKGTIELHMKVEMHLLTCQPTSQCSDKYPNDIEMKMNQIQFRGHNDFENPRADEEIDTFASFNQTTLTCQKNENCQFFFEFTEAQTFNITHTIEDPRGDGDNLYTVRIVAPEVDLVDSTRVGTDGGFEYYGDKQLRAFPIIKVFTDEEGGSLKHEANMRAIVRWPMRLDSGISGLANCSTNCNEIQYLQVEGSGWWINKEGTANNDPGGGGYATLEYNDGAPMAAYPTAALPVTYPLSADYVYQMPVAAGAEVSVHAEPCNTDCIVKQRDLAGFRTYLDPSFHAGTFDEATDREKIVCFDAHGGTESCAGGDAPDFPELKHSSKPYAEEDGVEDYDLTNNQRKVTFNYTDILGTPPENFPGLHKVVVVVRMPTQTDDHDADGIYDEPGSYSGDDVPPSDESTLFGVFVHYVAMRD
jgi:hypothetical protein